MGLATGAKDVLRVAFPPAFVRAPPEPARVFMRDVMLLMRGKPQSVTTGRELFYMLYEIVHKELGAGAQTYVLIFDKPFVPRAKGVEQASRDVRNPPLPDDSPIEIGDGPLPDPDTWQCLMANRRMRRRVFAYLTAKFEDMYAPPPGCDLYIDGGTLDADAAPRRIWSDDAGVRRVGDADVVYTNAIGEADIAIPFWIDTLCVGAPAVNGRAARPGRAVAVESIDTDFIAILAVREAQHAARPHAEKARVYLHLNARKESQSSAVKVAEWVDIGLLHAGIQERWASIEHVVETLALVLMPGNDFIENFAGIGMTYVWQAWVARHHQYTLLRARPRPAPYGGTDLVINPLALRAFVHGIYEEKGRKALRPPSDDEIAALGARMQWNLRYWRDGPRAAANAAPPVPDPLKCGWELFVPPPPPPLGSAAAVAVAAAAAAAPAREQVRRVATLPSAFREMGGGHVLCVRLGALHSPSRLVAAGATSLVVHAEAHALLNENLDPAACPLLPAAYVGGDMQECAVHVGDLVALGDVVVVAAERHAPLLAQMRGKRARLSE